MSTTGSGAAPGAPVKGRIVAGVDGSDSSLLAARWAANQARLTGSELRLVAAWNWPAMYGAVPAPGIDFEGDTRAVVAGIADQLRQEFPGVGIEFDVVCGPAAQALIEASRDADLLVVGSRGHGAFSGMLIGSVSLHAVHHAHCPVLVMRT